MSKSASIEEAKLIVFSSTPGVPPTLEVARALGTLSKACEDPSKITLVDMLRCLDFPGLIAEHGARFLYVRTGRDGLGWRAAGANGVPFRTDKQEWITYLRANGLL